MSLGDNKALVRRVFTWCPIRRNLAAMDELVGEDPPQSRILRRFLVHRLVLRGSEARV